MAYQKRQFLAKDGTLCVIYEEDGTPGAVDDVAYGLASVEARLLAEQFTRDTGVAHVAKGYPHLGMFGVKQSDDTPALQ